MHTTRPSLTALWVAAARSGFGVELPAGTKLCDDPYGIRFYEAGRSPLSLAARRLAYPAILRTPLLGFVLWMQIRTRFLDDLLVEFVRSGGRQVVLLGAGFDCRAARFSRELADSVVYEVDHPSTQAQKLRLLSGMSAPSAPVRYVAIDFEKQIQQLPALLAAAGHDPTKPTLTIWEGVTMYLTEPAIEASLAAVRAYSGTGSRIGITYFDLDRVTSRMRGTGVLARRVGEPWRFGWKPDALGAWLSAHSFGMLENRGDVELARRYLPERYAQRFKDRGRYIAVAEPRQ